MIASLYQGLEGEGHIKASHFPLRLLQLMILSLVAVNGRESDIINGHGSMVLNFTAQIIGRQQVPGFLGYLKLSEDHALEWHQLWQF